MYSVVLDTNLIVSAAFHPASSIPGQVLEAWFQDRFRLIISSSLLAEYTRVLFRPKIHAAIRWSDAELANTLALIERAAEVIVPGKLSIRVCRDPDDDKLLIAAKEGRADFIVTGDSDLLDLKSYGKTDIIRPAEFLSKL